VKERGEMHVTLISDICRGGDGLLVDGGIILK
jgi:hypothetical protein